MDFISLLIDVLTYWCVDIFSLLEFSICCTLAGTTRCTDATRLEVLTGIDRKDVITFQMYGWPRLVKMQMGDLTNQLQFLRIVFNNLLKTVQWTLWSFLYFCNNCVLKENDNLIMRHFCVLNILYFHIKCIKHCLYFRASTCRSRYTDCSLADCILQCLSGSETISKW